LEPALTAAIGMAFFQERLTFFKVFSMGLIFARVINLNLSTANQ